MHAIAATYFLGVNIPAIVSGLRDFRADINDSPGRVNVYDDLPFRIIIDFAHNPDGMRKICEFIDAQTTTGRKLVGFAGMANRDDAINRGMAEAIAGHFDHYFCKEYEPSEPPLPRRVAGFMQQVLIGEGVLAENTTVMMYGRKTIYEIFDRCEPGDLLLLLLGHVEKNTAPGYIRDYAARQT